MARLRDLGLLAAAVYKSDVLRVLGSDGFYWVRSTWRPAGRWSGFQAAAYTGRSCVVVAYRGTDHGMDVLADLKLGIGMNSSYFSEGEEFYEAVSQEHRGKNGIVLVGHSLGGAIAQVVGNRKGERFVTFNAPGVAVLASNNFGLGNLPGALVRAPGMIASAFRHPVQAAADVKAAFRKVNGLNLCLDGDMVSKIGLHYGVVRRITGGEPGVMSQHKIDTVNAVLGGSLGDEMIYG